MIETSIFSCKCVCHILQTSLSVVHTCSLATLCSCKHSVPVLLTIYSIIGLYTRTLKKGVKMFDRYNIITKFAKMLSEKCSLRFNQLYYSSACLSVVAKGRQRNASCFSLI